jgi:hypothetical protein
MGGMKTNTDKWVNVYSKEDLRLLCILLKDLDDSYLGNKINESFIVWEIIRHDNPGNAILNSFKSKIKRIEERNRTKGPEAILVKKVILAAKMMYEEKLGDLPLLINKRGKAIQTIIRWRLEIKK